MGKRIISVPVENLRPHPAISMFVVAEKDIRKLKRSIKRTRLYQPITIQTTDQADIYYVISGVARLEATKAVGKKKIRAIVDDKADPFKAYMQTNLNHRSRTPLEKAELIAIGLSNKKNKTAKELGKELGMSESSVSQNKAIAEKIDKDVLEELKKAKPNIKTPALRALTKLKKTEQKKFVNDLKQGKVEATAEGVKAHFIKSVEKKEKAVDPKTLKIKTSVQKLEEWYESLLSLLHDSEDLSSSDLAYFLERHNEASKIYNIRIKDQELKEKEKEAGDETQ